MNFRVTVAAAVLALGATRSAAAQAMVTFDVPLNPTQVHADIERIRVICIVMGEGIVLPTGMGSPYGNWNPLSETLPPVAARQELWVMAGQVVATVRVIVTIPAEYLQNPVGKTANYGCMVGGYSKTLQKWGTFSEASTELPFKMKVTPEGIQGGQFVW